MDIGGRLRSSRQQLGLTTQQVADMAGLSRASVSQLEGNRGNPSLLTLQKVAAVVGISLVELVEEDDPGNGGRNHRAPAEAAPPTQPPSRRRPVMQVVRKAHRKGVSWPTSHWHVSLLTPDVQGLLQVTLSETTPPDDPTGEWLSHEGEELGFVLEGTYEVIAGDETVILEEGDSVYLHSPTPHQNRLIGDRPGRMIWIQTPPNF